MFSGIDIVVHAALDRCVALLSLMLNIMHMKLYVNSSCIDRCFDVALAQG